MRLQAKEGLSIVTDIRVRALAPNLSNLSCLKFGCFGLNVLGPLAAQ
jgi:hypothetical protein